MNLLKMIITIIMFSLFIKCFSQDFKTQQKKNQRVKEAYNEYGLFIDSVLKTKKITKLGGLMIIAFKQEAKLEVYAKNTNDKQYSFLIDFNICSSAGIPGPKRVMGDCQVPEGFYNINYFNPWSNFFLSLKVSYPNASDKILGDKKNPGNDIFIHGSCVTIGCIPITDEKIKQLYILAIEAKNAGQQNIPVYIFPCKMDKEKMDKLKKQYPKKELIEFWDNIQIGYDKFVLTKNPVNFTIDKTGKYIFK